MKRNTAFVTMGLIVVLLLAVVCIRVFGSRNAGTPEPTPAASTATVYTPAPPPPAVTDPPETTPPAETATPAVVTAPPTAPPTPTPAPPPTPTPAPTVAPTASGSFSSSTGTYLNLVVNWSLYSEGGGNKLRVELAASSYSFSTDALWNALELRVNNAVYTADCPAVRYDGQTLRTTPLATFTVDAPSGSVNLTAVWHYKGSYSGVELNDITASGMIYI